MAPRVGQQQQSIAAFIVLGSAAGAVWAFMSSYPAMAVLWAGLLVAAWMEPPPLMTGPKVAGVPSPLDASEEAKQQSFRVWKTLQTAPVNPMTWLPGKDVLGVWVVAVLVGLFAWTFPVADLSWRWMNAAAGFISIVSFAHARRDAFGNPGTRLSVLTQMWGGEERKRLIVVVACGLLGALAVGYAILVTRIPYRLSPVGVAAGSSAALTLAGLVGLAARKVALAHWREVVTARAEWAPRWKGVKEEPAPDLLDVATIGPATVYDFYRRTGSADLLRKGPSITSQIGGGYAVAYLTMPNENTQGQPVPGTVHPNKFQIAMWPGEIPNSLDPNMPDDVRLLAARSEYQPRWANLKAEPAPVLTGSRMVGPCRVDTFSAGHQGAAYYWPLAQKLAPMVAGVDLAILPKEDSGPGSRSQVEFEVAHWPVGSLPDLTDPTVPPNVALLALRCAVTWTFGDAKYAIPTVLSMEPISDDEQPMAFLVRLGFPDGPSMASLRHDGLGAQTAARLGCDSAVDHRADSGAGRWYLGALDDTVFTDEHNGISEIAENIAFLRTEDRWKAAWTNVLKMGQQPPTMQRGSTINTSKTVDGKKVHRVVFATLQGIDPATYFGFEDKLKTTLVPSPFLATGYWSGSGSRSGERHAQAFCVYRSEETMPASPDALSPQDGAEWVLIGHVNAAFKAARLAQPEIVTSRCLTKEPERTPGRLGMRSNSSHIWEIRLRLYGGVTLADVRGAMARLRGSFGSPWLRIAPSQDGVTLYVGATPKSAELAQPARDGLRLASLDWEQAWLDSSVSGTGGLLPTLTAMATMPNNTAVSVLDFDLPPGADVPTIKKAIPKLRTATGNEFISVRAGKSGASSVTVLASPIDPMPRRAGYDYEFVTHSPAIPFATGVEGEPVLYDWAESPHLGVFGFSGGGKSVALAGMLTGAICRGAEVVVIDPSKGAADFKFAERWISCVATTVPESSAAIRAVYAEVVRRKNLNSQYGLDSYRKLPDHLRPRHLLLVIDEFTSLLGQEPVSRTPLDDMDAEAERQAIVEANAARTEVGVFVGKIAREARSAGVTLILATQKLTSKTLDTVPGGNDLKTNLARLLLGASTYGDRTSALRRPDEAPEQSGAIPPGRAIYEPSTGVPVEIQVWFDGTDKLAEFLETVEPAPVTIDMAPFMRVSKSAGPSVVAVSMDDLMGGSSEPVEFTLDDLEALTNDDDALDLSALVVSGDVTVEDTSELDSWLKSAESETEDADTDPWGDLAWGEPEPETEVPETPETATEARDEFDLWQTPAPAPEAAKSEPGPPQAPTPPSRARDESFDFPAPHVTPAVQAPGVVFYPPDLDF